MVEIMEKDLGEELLLINNSLQSCLQYDNAYFMNAYTVCRDIISDRCGDDTELEIALLKPAIEVLKYSSKIETLAIAMLMDIPSIVDSPEIQKLATVKNTVINSLKRKCVDGFSSMQPIKYSGYLTKIFKEGYDELFLCEMCALKVEAESVQCMDDITPLAYIDTLLDMNHLQLSGIAFEARNQFSIITGKMANKYHL